MENQNSNQDIANQNVEEVYGEELGWLFSQLPMFSRIGAAAYKPGLERTIALDNLFGNPHTKFKSVHIAGTNGKGSSSHMLASILQEHRSETGEKFKVGLYTSPHLVDFRERIRVNGEMIPKEEVIAFTRRWKDLAAENPDLRPSFFELTMTMAFDWFARQGVDYAVIETGMGGRLDSTNIIMPILTCITNISFDHTQFLGDTLAKIAGEKAGIMKEGIPTVIGEVLPETKPVFDCMSGKVGCLLRYSEESPMISRIEADQDWGWQVTSHEFGSFRVPLAGDYQKKNISTVLNMVSMLPELQEGDRIRLDLDAVARGFENVERNTGFRGRWTRMSAKPLTICDTGHNEAGLSYTIPRLEATIGGQREKNPAARLRIVLGFVADKDVDHILPLFPRDAEYYITQASIPRAMDCGELSAKCRALGLRVCGSWGNVKEAAEVASTSAAPEDVIFIGGSTFVVADYLS